MSALAAIVLCAGKGTRMKSERVKVLHPLLGRPLCYYPLRAAFSVGAQPVVAVVGHQAEQVQAELRPAFEGRPLSFVVQAAQNGTADAVLAAKAALAAHRGSVLILYGDVPLLRSETLRTLVTAFESAKAPLALLTTVAPEPSGYGRVVRQGERIQRIVEDKDATEKERQLTECNAGVYVVDAAFLWAELTKLRPNNAQGELYLTDLVAAAAALGDVPSVAVAFEECAGVNDRAELARLARTMQQRIQSAHMRAGVTLQDPSSTWIDDDVELSADVTLGPQVSLHGRTRIEPGAVVEQGCILSETRVGRDAVIQAYSVLEGAEVGALNRVGPFARLRPGTVLSENVHVGNFVEVKNTRMGSGAKANHLSYLGDAEIGAKVNVGAGTITCNYDGAHKHKTILEDGVFVGSDTQFVAPVRVGARSVVGAGSTVTKDVPEGSLVLSRVPQVVKAGWADRKTRPKKP
ncbi:MAG: bifunctional UDP-N-acetylglucosamine diphosphorylase/glucosamine-1-phosphate N-acetyltransferase GlmU [Myxococcaceae bacterium]